MPKNKKTESAHRNLTFSLGLVLFSLIVVGVVTAVIVPWVMTLFDPEIVKQNVAFMLIATTLGVILPMFVSYVMGYTVTHSKDKALRRYNGVLFGAAAFWLSTVFSTLGSGMTSWASDYNASAVINLFPAAATLLVMILVAYVYSERKETASMLDFSLYQLILVAPVVGFLVLHIAQLPVVVVVAAVAAIAYKLSGGKPALRLLSSLLALSMGFAALYASSLITWSFFPQLSDMTLILIGSVFGLAVWAIYLRTVTARA